MKCEQFLTWLEARDIHDVSEGDRAHKHAAECISCGELLKKDEYLDAYIATSLAAQPLPDGLQGRLDISLDRMQPKRSGKGLLVAVATLCFVIATLFFLHKGEQQRFGTMDELSVAAMTDYLDHGDMKQIYEPVTDAARWLGENGKEAIEPPLLLTEGYHVRGARFCHLGLCNAVHMLYEKDGKSVALFVIDAKEVGFHLEQGRLYTLSMEGNSVKIYTAQGVVYAFVS